jgi:hypothetical protein
MASGLWLFYLAFSGTNSEGVLWREQVITRIKQKFRVVDFAKI